MMEKHIGLENEFTAFRRIFNEQEEEYVVLSHVSPPSEQAISDIHRALVLLPYSVGKPFYDAARRDHWDIWLANGGRFYSDDPSWEYSSPECLSAKDLVLADKAGDIILRKIFGELKWQDTLYLVKRSATRDMRRGATWGCHENYTVGGKVFMDLTIHEDFRHRRAIFESHLVSRQIYTGAGHLEYDVENGPLLDFWVSPRTFFINSRITHATRHRTGEDRGIINTRERDYMRGRGDARLHVICGDLNRSDWSTYLKVGSTALVLAYLQVVDRKSCQNLANIIGMDAPVEVFKRSSMPFSGDIGKELFYRNIATQEEILSEIESRLDDLIEFVPDAREIVEIWGAVLSYLPDALEGKKTPLSSKLDWLIKKRLFEERSGRDIRSLRSTNDKDLARRLTGLDLSYHRLNHNDLYREMVKSGLITDLFSREEALAFCVNPPPGRARMRTRTAEYMYENTDLIEDAHFFRWDHIDVKFGEDDPNIPIDFCVDNFDVIKSQLDKISQVKKNRKTENGGEQ